MSNEYYVLTRTEKNIKNRVSSIAIHISHTLTTCFSKTISEKIRVFMYFKKLKNRSLNELAYLLSHRKIDEPDIK